MTTGGFAALDRALDSLPMSYAGPGGAAAVLRDGRVIASRSWGFADTERRIAFTPRTLFRICSITKQFTCSLLLDMVGDPAALDEDVARALPRLSRPPSARALCDNQSGMRDYWALAMLCGAPVEGVFGDAEARRLIEGTRSLHFAPGTRYSYCNQNFRMLGDILAARGGQDFGALLRERIFARAGMDTRSSPPTQAKCQTGRSATRDRGNSGFRPAVNRIVWTGDAGIGACLDDMIAWESFIDATRDDADGLYRRLSAPATFADGAPAWYSFGLGQGTLLGRRITGHGGGLRGWRSYRLHCAAERVSVVVLFNHMADAREAAAGLFTAVFDETAPPADAAPVDPAWSGGFLEPDTRPCRALGAGGIARAPALRRGRRTRGPDDGGRFRQRRSAADARRRRRVDGASGGQFSWPADPRRGRGPGATSRACSAAPSSTPSSRSFRRAVFFTGLARGFWAAARCRPCSQSAGDVWRMPCARALDYHAPGDWTLVFARDDVGRVSGVRVGCWLARGLEYVAA